jgi:hypothetical protein
MKIMKIVLGVLTIIVTVQIKAEDKELEKRQAKAIEQFVVSSRKSDGNYSSFSLKNWKVEIGINFLTTEDMVRRVLNAFEEHYKNLDIKSYLVTYTNKVGPGGGIELDFLIIHHETKAKKVYKFGTKDEL